MDLKSLNDIFGRITPTNEHGFKTIAVLGAGLIGGSIAHSSQRAGLIVRVWDPDESTLLIASHLGFQTYQSAEETVDGADLIVLAGPVDTITSTAKIIAPYVKLGAVVTDVASVKTEVSTGMTKALAQSGAFVVPGHPMAGKATGGITAAEVSLFEGCTWLFTSDPESEPIKRVAAFVKSLGARQVATVDPKTHDILVSLISHTPQVISSVLAAGVGADPLFQAASLIAGSGFRDTTRIAASSWSMWEPIVHSNRAALIIPLTMIRDRLTLAITGLLAEDYSKLAKIFEDGSASRLIFDNPQSANIVQVINDTNSEKGSTQNMNTTEDVQADAWTDKSMGWTTVRTSASDPIQHAVLACHYLAGVAGMQVDTSELATCKDTIAQIAKILNVELVETWTADGFFVRGVEISGTYYVIP